MPERVYIAEAAGGKEDPDESRPGIRRPKKNPLELKKGEVEKEGKNESTGEPDDPTPSA